MSNNDNIKLHLMNIRFERVSMSKEIRTRFNFNNFLQFFEIYVIDDLISQKSLELSYIDQIFKMIKKASEEFQLNMINQISKRNKSYFKDPAIISKLKNHQYLIHYIAKFDLSIKCFLATDKFNKTFKFKIDNNNHKAYNYYLINKNNQVINDLLDMKIDKNFNRNYFSSLSLLYLYFYNSENMNKVNFKTIIRLFQFDNDRLNEISNISVLFDDEKLALQFLVETGSQFSCQIISTYLDSYLSPINKKIIGQKYYT